LNLNLKYKGALEKKAYQQQNMIPLMYIKSSINPNNAGGNPPKLPAMKNSKDDRNSNEKKG